jgi:hypothetical protein
MVFPEYPYAVKNLVQFIRWFSNFCVFIPVKEENQMRKKPPKFNGAKK